MDNEHIAVQQPAENVEQTTEQTPQEKTYTQTQVNAMMGRRLSRQEAQIRAEYEKQYGPLVDVLKAGTGESDLGKITDTLTGFYKERGAQIPKSEQKPTYSEKDMKLLAGAEAQEIIREGLEAVEFEVDRLAALGADKMSPRDKELYRLLGKHRQEAERGQKLSQLGVTEDVWKGEEFRSFASQFTSSTPIEKIYEIYQKTQPQTEVKNMGSMKNGPTGDTGVKEFYSLEEARKFTKEDFDKDPKLYEAVRKSMAKWK